ncbi:MAG TPA: amidohydrolase family protein [Gemmatimonadales bacterium]|nr:amidohydrolase family protein [Gemmatimonadales bacterium]
MTARATLTLLLTLAATAPASAQDRGLTAFTDVTVIPMDRERALPRHTVVVEGDRIVAVGPSGSVRVPPGARRVDGRGKFLLPGLAEMHGHIPPGDQVPDAQIEKVLAYFALNGVTTVRGMLGHPRHLGFRERAARGELLSPTIYTSGPSLNGNSVPTVAAAQQAVASQKAAGYDLLKIHPGLQPEVFDSLAAAARRHGLRFAGHVPVQVGIRRALARGIATVDHVDGYLEGLAWDGEGAAPESQMFGFNLVDRLDWARLPALVEATKRAGAAIVPTQSLFETLMGGEDPAALATRPEMRRWPAATVTQWTQMTANTREGLGVDPASGAAFNAARRRVMRALYEAGVPFLLGSDAPQWWNVPGFSLQRELDAMVAAGFTPWQALAMGSRNVATHFGAEAEFGTVAAGRRADLVLLDADPTTDVANWSRKAGVMLRGRWFDRTEIDRRLEELSR